MRRRALCTFMRRSLIPLLVLGSVILSLVPAAVVSADAVVTFPDPNLRSAIREAIGRPTGDIYESDILELDFDASDRGIADLTGLEACRHMFSVYLNSNRIRDISPLSNVEGVSHLFLDHNQISDISPLSGLGVSDLLILSHNEISDFSGLHDVGGDTVDLSYNRISSLSLPSNFHVNILFLDNNQISDIGPLVNNPSLVCDSVGLRGNPLSAISINTYIPALKARGVRVSWDSYPDRPVNVSPADGATGVAMTPRLQGSPFSEPEGETHVASSWQVRSSTGNYNSPVWQSGTTSPAATAITVPVGKLKNGTAYHWRVGYKDSGGLWSSYSEETSFTTIEAAAVPPTAATVAASSIGSTSATLNLSLSSLGSASSVLVSFEWGPGTAYGNTTTPQAMTGTGSFSYPLSGLSPATTYYFRAKAEGAGTRYGSDMTFTTASTPVSPPTVTTNAATSAGMVVDTLNGALTGLGSAASVQVSFEWGLTASYGNSTPARALTATGSYSTDLTGLAAGTTYHYRAKAVGDDTAYGNDMTFTTISTPTTPPAVTTEDADSVTASSARLNGNLTSLGTASSATVSFVWGTTQGGPYTHETTGAVQTTGGAFHLDLSGLAAGTTFYYQAKAVGDGTSYGAEESFTTAATAGGAPVIGSLLADNGRPGDDLTLTITGSNLTGATAVSFGAGITVNEFRVVSDSETTAKIAIASGAEAGDRNVTVITPQGTGTAPGAFKVNEVGSKVHLWVYLVAVAGGLAVLGLVASLGVWLLRRPAKPTP